jgi:LruC domain-containing protein
LIDAVTGTDVTSEYIQLNANGTEAGHQNATIMVVWDDAYRILPSSWSSIGVNTQNDSPFVIPDTMRVTITFTQPIPLNQLGVPPYNPFLIVDKQRGIEVHLPNKAPTALADASLLGTGHDNSIPGDNRYYQTQKICPGQSIL